MSAIQSYHSERRLTIDATGSESVAVQVHAAPTYPRADCIDLNRAEFLAAVASELNVRIVPADAIVVERSELPGVDADGYADGIGWGAKDRTKYPSDYAAKARRSGLAFLAVAEYLDANPPVDDAQVAVVMDTIRAADIERTGQSLMDSDYRLMAVSLIRAGVRVVTS